MVSENKSLVNFLSKNFFKLFVFFLVVSISYEARSWELIASGSNFKEYFKNPARSGRTASILSMRDYNSEMEHKGKKYLSVKKMFQFDCTRSIFRLSLVEKYEKNKLKGDLRYVSKTKSGWETVSPNTLNEMAMKKACKKKN